MSTGTFILATWALARGAGLSGRARLIMNGLAAMSILQVVCVVCVCVWCVCVCVCVCSFCVCVCVRACVYWSLVPLPFPVGQSGNWYSPLLRPHLPGREPPVRVSSTALVGCLANA